MDELIQFAHRLADAARLETMPRFGAGCAAEDKNAGGAFDPVTEADRAAEQAMRALIEEHHPQHGIAGEEFGLKPPQGRWCWSLDPIDGTRAFLFGLPNWVTLIALLYDGRPVLGIVDVPRLDERYAGAGSGASLRSAGGEAATAVSRCGRLAEARLTTTDPALFGGGEVDAFAAVCERVRLVRYGLDGYGYARLAAGSIDLVIESGLKPHDYNAVIPLVRAAGGVVGDWSGGEDFEPGRIVAAATRALFEEAIELLSSRRPLA